MFVGEPTGGQSTDGGLGAEPRDVAAGGGQRGAGGGDVVLGVREVGFGVAGEGE